MRQDFLWACVFLCYNLAVSVGADTNNYVTHILIVRATIICGANAKLRFRFSNALFLSSF